jgi:hypothetical protein
MTAGPNSQVGFWGNANSMSFGGVAYKVGDFLYQQNKVCMLFVPTGSASPIILATCGLYIGGKDWAATKHPTIMQCRPQFQDNEWGIQVRINFVSDQPQPNDGFQLTLAQYGATKFDPPKPFKNA